MVDTEDLVFKPQVIYYQMSQESLAATGQIEPGLALLTRAEASSLISPSDECRNPLFRTLFEACRAAGQAPHRTMQFSVASLPG